MPSESSGHGERVLAPGEAFAAIGHETRAKIVEALATTPRPEKPLSFSELRDRVGTGDSAKFNYHLDVLVGHFVERRPDGTRSGERASGSRKRSSPGRSPTTPSSTAWRSTSRVTTAAEPSS